MSSKLQGILVQLLKEVDDICRKNDIRYYIWGGTCIGQLRHGGFIPWDDDIDIVMPRNDYEKFEAIIDQYLPEGRDLVSVGRYNTYTNPIPRYMDLNTTALRSGRLGDGTICGECIEIFILDPMPKDRGTQEEWKKLLYVYCEILCTGWIQAKRRLRKKYIDVELYLKYRESVKQRGRMAVLSELERKLFNIDENESEVYCLRWMPRGLYEIPIKCFGKPQDVVYEGMHVLGPERPAEMLQLYIGYSWRNLLPPDEREGHPTLVDHDLACGNCEREYLQLRSTEQIASDLQQYKDLSMEYYRLRNESYVDRAMPIVKYVIAKINKAYLKYGREQLAHDSKLTIQEMGEFIRLQRNSLFKYNDIMIPVDDDLLDVIAEAMFNEAMIQQLFDILHIKQKNADQGKLQLTSMQEEYYRASKDFLKISVHLDEREYEQAEAIYHRYEKKYPDHLWLHRCRMCIDSARAGNGKDYENIINYGKTALNLYPEDDVLLKRYADALLHTGIRDEAERIYTEVSKTSINGLLLREMKEYGIEEAGLKLDAKVWEF